MDNKNHWEQIYQKKKAEELSWFQKEPKTSLRFIESLKLKKDEWIIDVGGGESTLVDELIKRNFTNISVLDISNKALEENRLRLKDHANKVEWIESDILNFQSSHKYSLWHDRAVFHFLTQEQDRQIYLKKLNNVVQVNGHLIIATFSPRGPKKCSGLDIVQYDEVSLSDFFSENFILKKFEIDVHHTPWGSEQEFIYCHFQKVKGT